MDFLKILKNKYFLLSFGAIVTTMALFCFEQYPKDRISFGVKIGKIGIGGKTKKEVKEILQKEINNLSKKTLVFEIRNKEAFNDQKNKKASIESQAASQKENKKEIKVKDLSPNYDLEKSINNAFFIGKSHSFFTNVKEKFFALFGQRKIELSVEIKNNELDNFINENFGQFETLPQNAQVYFEEIKDYFEIKSSKPGEMFPREKIKKNIENSLKNFETVNICLLPESNNIENENSCFYPEIAQPEIKTSAAKKAKEEANKIINSGPYILLTDYNSYTVQNNTLGAWFLFVPKNNSKNYNLEVSLDEELIKTYLAELSQNINIEPENPVLAFRGGKIKIISPPKNGKTLNAEKSTKTIKKEILKGKNRIKLSLEKKEPDITEEKIKNLKIEKLIARGTSNFSGSPKNRINNIRVAASKFNGILIAPGEVFSFNGNLGNVGPKEGYLPELVIKDNKTIPEFGGGVCQVSTTMFRAAVNSGMEIIERYAHAFPVKYYDPQGFDATVYQPSPDLKFKNNTPGYILIQSKISGYNLTFEFYGRDDGRKVIVKGPYQYAFKKSGAMKAKLIEEVWKEDKLIYKKTFLSSYDSPKKYPVER